MGKKKKKRKFSKSKVRILLTLFIFVTITMTLGYDCLNNILEIQSMKKEKKILEEQLVVLKEEKEVLKNDILILENYFDKYIRETHHYSKPGEVILKFD